MYNSIIYTINDIKVRPLKNSVAARRTNYQEAATTLQQLK